MSVIARRSAGETRDPERILPEHWLPPEICDPTSERPSPGETVPQSGTSAAARSELWSPNALHPDGGLGGGWLSLVGAAESGFAGIGDLGPQAGGWPPRDRAATC